MTEFDKAPVQSVPSVFYAESPIDCSLEKAWNLMLDYQAWNPNFANAQVTRLRGEPSTEGELVLVKILGAQGEALAEFYAETVKVVPQRNFVWYVYPKEGGAFRNFVDFGLSETASGVKFEIHYYAQNPLSGEALVKHRQDSQAAFRNLAAAFKKYCESQAA